jgi:uncharacterized lipoprotein YmbA
MRRRSLLLAPGALVLARCASPDPAIYTLRAVPGSPEGGGPPTIKLARPGLAGYLDRPEIVRDSSSSRLTLNGGERWGEPVGDMIGRVLALDLAQRLPGSSVFTEAGTISVDPAATVELDVQRFDLDASGVVVLLVQVAVEQGMRHDPVATRSLRLTAQPAATTTPDVVGAMSTALGQLADQIAGMLRAMVPLPLPQPTRRR